MTIMTDGEIVDALDSGEITITPLGSRAEQIQPCSVDLRLSREMMRYKPRLRAAELLPTIRLGMALQDEMEMVDCGVKSVFTIAPGEFALGVTMERVKLPANILGRVEGRSSIGRAGLFVHVTAGFIDPGFDGRITLEFYNGSPRVIEIPVGFRVCQIALQRLTAPCVRPYGVARGSKYVGAASDSVQPARAETRVASLLKLREPPDVIKHECPCGHKRATYHYDWKMGRAYYACAACDRRAED